MSAGDNGFEAFEAEFADHTVIESEAEVMHLFFGLMHILNGLDATPVIDLCRTEFEWFGEMWDNPQTFWSAALAETVPEKQAKFIDRCGDLVHFATPRTAEWLMNLGIGRLELYVFLPCHGAFHRLSWNTELGGFAIR